MISIQRRKTASFALQSVDESSKPFDDTEPYVLGDARRWDQLTRVARSAMERSNKRHPTEIKIYKALSSEVEVKFNNRPLKEVIETLSTMANINVVIEDRGLAVEGVTSDTPVTLNLTQPISLKSAFTWCSPAGPELRGPERSVANHKRANPQSRSYARVYYVADLVMPIPNFVPSYNPGLPGPSGKLTCIGVWRCLPPAGPCRGVGQQ